MSDTEDARLTAAREFHAGGPGSLRVVLGGLIAYAEERYRVNVGLVNENAALRKQVREPERGPSLEAVPTADLLAEVTRRLA